MWKWIEGNKKVEIPGFHLVLTSEIDLTKPTKDLPADHLSLIGKHPKKVLITVDLERMKFIEVMGADGKLMWREGQESVSFRACRS